jgi:hypothetical protein
MPTDTTTAAPGQPTAAPSARPRDLWDTPPGSDYAAHVQTYRGFIKGTVLFVAHAAVLLLLLAYFLT